MQKTFEPIEFRMLGGIHLTGLPDESAHALLARPRLVALLATLAAAEAPFLRRDHLIALFWPDLSQERARAALRKAVYLMRQALGEAAIVNRGAEELGLAAHITSDHAHFRRALAAGDLHAALDHYRGELLPAFHLADAPEWERWLDDTRARVRAQAHTAVRTLIADASDSQDWNVAALWARRAAGIAPDEESTTRELIELLDLSGDRAGALQAYRALEQHLQNDYDGTPAPETRELFERIRARATQHSRLPDPVPSASAPLQSSSTASELMPSLQSIEAARASPELSSADSTPASRGSATKHTRVPNGKRVIAAVVVLALIIAIVVSRWNDHAHADEDFAPLAVGTIVDYTGGSDSIGAALADLLATNLARVPGLPVLSTSRLYELMGNAAGRRSSLSTAARAAGAGTLLEGAVHRGDDGLLRLELRRVELESGAVADSYTATAHTLLELSTRITVQIASSMRLAPPSQPLAGVTTSSEAAFLLYERGLRAYYREHLDDARVLFERAVALDSSFALATWYLARTLTWQQGWIPTFERAVRLSDRATERERLMIRADWANAMDDPSLLAIADTLASRYPLEPMGHMMLAQALINVDRPLEAVPHLRRVIQLDTLSLLQVTPNCRACDAVWLLAGAYGQADSLEAAERVTRAWVQASPQSAPALGDLAYKLEFLGRYDEAERALHAMHQLDPRYQRLEYRLSALEMARGRFDIAERYARDGLRTYPDEAAAAHWHVALALMNQGRLREALAAADSFRRAVASETSNDAYLRGILLMRMQRGREAAALFDSIARAPDRNGFPPTKRGRQLAGQYLHVAEALTINRDTVALRRIENIVREQGALSGYVRDQRLHHHVRGLRLALENRHAEAAQAFRASLFGAAGTGYQPSTVELGRSLIAANRSEEAIHWLRAALRGPVGAAGTWVWRTEVHELLALAYDRAGQTDRALEHYRIAHDALQNADPEVAPMRARIAARIAALADR